MLNEKTLIDLSADDDQETVASRQHENISTTEENRNADSDILDMAGRPRVLNIDRPDANNIASFAKEYELADLILTLVNLAEGPRGVSACTQKECDIFHYRDRLRVPASLVCGTSEGDIC